MYHIYMIYIHMYYMHAVPISEIEVCESKKEQGNVCVRLLGIKGEGEIM